MLSFLIDQKFLPANSIIILSTSMSGRQDVHIHHQNQVYSNQCICEQPINRIDKEATIFWKAAKMARPNAIMTMMMMIVMIPLLLLLAQFHIPHKPKAVYTHNPILLKDVSNFSIPDLPKAYIHIGAPKTGTTSIQNTMMRDKDILKQDKYFLVLHGQPVLNEGKYIVDNIFLGSDRLAACIWSDEQRNQIIAVSGNPVAGSCPDFLLPTFNEFLARAITAQSDVVISNEWLSNPSSETGLLNILDGWDPTIVIYYRRFFDWMVSAHYQWHLDIGINVIESMQGKVRLLDFFRRICGRLFERKPSNISDSLVDLIDIGEYSYHMWKRYNVVYTKNIKIVNFHDHHIVQSFYCDVLDASNACEMEKVRLASSETTKSNTKSSTEYLDLAIGLQWKLIGQKEQNNSDTMKSFNEIGDRFNKLMSSKGLTENDLPQECLSEREKSLLLAVSLEYERILLPDSYVSGGKHATSQHFAEMLSTDSFCSVDIDAVLTNVNWTFLIDGLSTINS